jgi:hypothetical protein
MDKSIFIMLRNYYNKNSRLPPENRMLVIDNFLKKGDILDYFIEKKKKQVIVHYTYYDDKKNEKKFISSKLVLNLRG